jgi:PAS domain S-box-containing protein
MTRYRHAEAERRRLDRQAAIVEFSSDAIIAGTSDGIVTTWNPAAERLFGYSREEMIGKSASLLRARGHDGNVRDIIARYKAGESVENFQATPVRKDGTPVPVSLSVSPLFDENGAVVGASAIARDVSAQRRAFETSQHMAAIVQNSGEAIISSTLDGIITSWNPAAEMLFGYTSEEIIGKSGRHLSPQDRTQEIREILARIGEGRGSESVETHRVRKDGMEFPVTVTVSPIRDKDGAIVGASAITRDITDQKEALEIGRRMATIVEFSDDAIISSTLDGIVTSWNPAAERLYGYSADEQIGHSAHVVTPADRKDEIKAILAKIALGQPVEHLETTRLRKDGTVFPVSLTVSPIRNADGEVTGASVISRDVTPQRHALESAQRLAQIIEHSDDAIISRTLDGTITSWNPAAEKLFGYTAEEAIGQSSSLTTPEDLEGEIDDNLSDLRAGQPVLRLETIRVRRDGTRIPVSLTASPIRDAVGNIVGASAILRDLTAQAGTFESGRSMIETSQDPFVAISPEGQITDANEATVKVTGVPRDKLIGTSFSDYFTDPDKAAALYQKVIEQGSVTDYPLTMRHKDGHETFTSVLYNASPYRDTTGKVLGVFAAARDVTEPRRAAQYSRSLIEAALDPMVTISPEGKITDTNEATAKATGVPRDKLIGTSFSDYFTDPDKAEASYQKVFEEGSVTDYPLTLRHKDGHETLTEVLYNASLYRDATGKVLGVFATARDITKQIAAQKDIAERRARELERLAELERFQRLTVGRELKMIELKKEIEYLKKYGPTSRGERGDQH